MRKGLADQHARAQAAQAVNERYLDALADVDTDAPLGTLLADVCKRDLVRLARAGRKWHTEILTPVSSARFWSSDFHSRTHASLLPPQSATMRSASASGYAFCPSVRHRPRIVRTPKAAVSWSIPTPTSLTNRSWVSKRVALGPRSRIRYLDMALARSGRERCHPSRTREVCMVDEQEGEPCDGAEGRRGVCPNGSPPPGPPSRGGLARQGPEGTFRSTVPTMQFTVTLERSTDGADWTSCSQEPWSTSGRSCHDL
jgi:hypothetical protein